MGERLPVEGRVLMADGTVVEVAEVIKDRSGETVAYLPCSAGWYCIEDDDTAFWWGADETPELDDFVEALGAEDGHISHERYLSLKSAGNVASEGDSGLSGQKTIGRFYRDSNGNVSLDSLTLDDLLFENDEHEEFAHRVWGEVERDGTYDDSDISSGVIVVYFRERG